MNYFKKSIQLTIGILYICTVQAQYDPRIPFEGKLGKTIEETQLWYPQKKTAPAGAPNVIWILLDDVGYSATSAFGGLIETPVFESLANNGLRYTNFHNVGVCAPTRAALLSGRNSHAVGFGYFPSNETTPGYHGRLPFETGLISEVLLENGYNTFAVGKWHVAPYKEESSAGPFNRWPLGRGFEQFYGFLGGATDQWHPELWEGNQKINTEPNKTHLTQLLADKAISYIANQKSANTEKPFFLYLAPGATHSPHQAPAEWIKKYKGKFDGGWDKHREIVFNRQKKLGVIPQETVLPHRDPQVQEWNSLNADQKKLYAHFMEVYAAYMSHTDYEIGRIINYLKKIGQFDNTLIIAVLGDNGGTKRGAENGTLGEESYVKKTAEQQKEEFAFMLTQTDRIGGELSYPVYPQGWGHADNTPFNYWKYDANGEGGTHTPVIISYPAKIKERGVRPQYGHVIDLLPTTIALTGTKIPEIINGYKQDTIQGYDLSYSVKDSSAASVHTLQYYEIAGNRAIYKDGWKAAAYHNDEGKFEDDKWQLFHLAEDWSESKDLAAEFPDKLKELKNVFDQEAAKYNIYPVKGRSYIAKPDPEIPKKNKYIFYPGVAKLRSNEVPNLSKGGFTIVADANIAANTKTTVLYSDGGKYGGINFSVNNGKLHFSQTDGIRSFALASEQQVPLNASELKLEYVPDADKLKGGNILLFINNKQVAKGYLAGPLYKRVFYSSAFDGVEIGKKELINKVSVETK